MKLLIFALLAAAASAGPPPKQGMLGGMGVGGLSAVLGAGFHGSRRLDEVGNICDIVDCDDATWRRVLRRSRNSRRLDEVGNICDIVDCDDATWRRVLRRSRNSRRLEESEDLYKLL